MASAPAPPRSAPPADADGTDPGRVSRFGASAFEEEQAPQVPVQWVGWRLGLVVAVALLGVAGIFLLMRAVAATPTIDATWQVGPQGEVVLATSAEPALQGLRGRPLTAVIARDGAALRIDAAVLRHAPRWAVDEAARRQLTATHAALSAAFEQGQVQLRFDPDVLVAVAPVARGVGGLGPLFLPLTVLAWLLFVVGIVTWLARLQLRNALYALTALCQAGNLLFIALEMAGGLALPPAVIAHDFGLRMGFDLVTAAAILHSTTLRPRTLPRGDVVAGAGWCVVAAALLLGQLSGAGGWFWWTAQGSIVALGIAAIAMLTWSYRIEPNPFVLVSRRLGLLAVGSLTLLTLAIAAVGEMPGVQERVAETVSVVWYVFFASLLLLAPVMTRSHRLLREFALLAGVATVATSIDLLFVTLFSFGEFSALAASLFLSLGIYLGARQWILDQLTGSNTLTLERSFEELYRVAREVEAHPELHRKLMLGLLRNLFEPLEVLTVTHSGRRARVVGSGSALLVPTPERPTPEPAAADAQAWVLRFARRGKRIFTVADARLADRVADQLRRAVAYDKAVERGRSEERQRIAQDLHDDIGARLLTLIYKAQNREMEDYLRHTLRDLKTLTRGLAATEHRLSHAAAEWKTDIVQRLTEAQIDLGWSFSFDRDITLTVVQWSALTRILRELVTNAIYHSHAERVEIVALLDQARFALSVSDDGNGRDPQAWAHGLGLGGVRKRVKLLGGRVQWRESQPAGICCEVEIPQFVERAAVPADDPRS